MIIRDPNRELSKAMIKLLLRLLPPDSKLAKQLKKILLMKN